MYWPRHRPQLTGIPTESVDCGVRTTQMLLDALSEGDVTRNVSTIRAVGQMGDGPTNYYEWDRVLDVLGGRTEGFSGEKVNDWDAVKQHLRNGGWVGIAVHYGTLRSIMPAKVGSLTFNGYHAIALGGDKKSGDTRMTRSFDSLLDGRYLGCPDGPVWVPHWKVRKAAEAVGNREGIPGGVFAVLGHPDKVIEPTDPGAPLDVPAGFSTLPDILSDLAEVVGMTSEADVQDRVIDTIDSLRLLLGLQGNPEADADTPVDSGISVTEG